MGNLTELLSYLFETQEERKPKSDDRKKLKQLEREMAHDRDAKERKEREADAARAEVRAKENQDIIAASKPKAKKAKEAQEAKMVKAEAKKAKAEEKKKAKEAKAAEKAKATQQKKEQQAEKKRKKDKEKGVTKWDFSESEQSEEEEGSREPDAPKKARDWEDWVIMGHETGSDDGKCRFRVAMYGFPPEENEEELWATKQNIKDDGAWALLEDYIKSHANFSPYSDLLLPTKRVPKKTAPAPVQVDRSKPCCHGNYQQGYIKEDHPGHAKFGGYLHDLGCSGEGCEKTFAPDLKEVKRLGQEKASRPTGDKPVYCCMNISGRTAVYRVEVCRHALCNECWSQAMLANEEGRKAAGGSGRRASRVH